MECCSTIQTGICKKKIVNINLYKWHISFNTVYMYQLCIGTGACMLDNMSIEILHDFSLSLGHL